jgi:hypothetical protein
MFIATASSIIEIAPKEKRREILSKIIKEVVDRIISNIQKYEGGDNSV